MNDRKTPLTGDKEAAPSYDRIQRAAELLKIRKFAQPTPPLAVVVDTSVVAAPPGKPEAPLTASHAPVSPETDERTIVDPRLQANADRAEAALPSDYAELKRQALARAQSQMPAESRLALVAGTTLQEYRIEWTLGVGGFGITYLATDTNLEMQVALKEYFPSDLVRRESGGKVRVKQQDEEAAFLEGRDKFLIESRTLAKFNHPNVVKVSRFFQANETAYMVMNYESGDSFKGWLGQAGKIDEQQLLKMFLPLLDGLDVVHQAGFLHRDIKPANIFVRKDDSLVLLDFGAARHAIGNHSRSLTTIVTPGYAPFEQYHSHGKQGPWTDIYALGGVLYWAVTGNKPFEAPARIKSDGMLSATNAAHGRFSASVLAAIDWALMPDENKRPNSIAEFRQALTAPAPVVVSAGQAAGASQSKPRSAASPSEPDKKSWWKLKK